MSQALMAAKSGSRSTNSAAIPFAYRVNGLTGSGRFFPRYDRLYCGIIAQHNSVRNLTLAARQALRRAATQKCAPR